jgi:hypothetical protein
MDVPSWAQDYSIPFDFPGFSLFFRRESLFIEDFQDFQYASLVFSLRFSLKQGEWCDSIFLRRFELRDLLFEG